MKKYTFIEFIAALESKDFDKIEDSCLNWANECMSKVDFTKEVHGGDCTNHAYSCTLCFYENMLKQYKMYYFEEEKYREEYL